MTGTRHSFPGIILRRGQYGGSRLSSTPAMTWPPFIRPGPNGLIFAVTNEADNVAADWPRLSEALTTCHSDLDSGGNSGLAKSSFAAMRSFVLARNQTFGPFV